MKIETVCPSCEATVTVEPSRWQGLTTGVTRYHCPRCDEDIWHNPTTDQISPYPNMQGARARKEAAS